MDIKIERWRAVPGYEGYYIVNDFGEVKSIDRTVVQSNGRKRFFPGKMLKPGISSHGYNVYELKKIGRREKIGAHQLVAMAFLGHKRDGTHKVVVDHKDGDKLNNYVDNLQLITNRKNLSKDKRNKTGYVGVVKVNSKIKPFQAAVGIGKNTKIYLGSFKTALEASEFRKLALENINLYKGDSKDFRNKLRQL